MSEPEWCIRSGRPADRGLLALFACADPAVGWQVDVEQFIHTQLPDWTFDPHAVSGDPRLLLAFVTATRELYGLVEEMSRPHPDYRRIVTPHKTQVQDSDQT